MLKSFDLPHLNPAKLRAQLTEKRLSRIDQRIASGLFPRILLPDCHYWGISPVISHRVDRRNGILRAEVA